jgi:cytochrome P450
MTTLMKEQIQKDSLEASSAMINIDDWAARVSLDIIGKAGFGSDFHSLAQPENPLNLSYRAAFVPNDSSRKVFIWSLITHPKFISLLPIENAKRLRQGVQAVTIWIRNFIAKRQDATAENVEKEGSKVLHQDIISAASKDKFILPLLTTLCDCCICPGTCSIPFSQI